MGIGQLWKSQFQGPNTERTLQMANFTGPLRYTTPYQVPGFSSVYKYVAWNECNFGDPARVAETIAGIYSFLPLTREFFVSCTPGGENIYDDFWNEFGTSIRLVPGVKFTSVFPVNGDGFKIFDSQVGWDAAIDSIELCLQKSRANTCILETESASVDYIDGSIEVDFDVLEAQMDKLPKGIDYIWWPGPSSTLSSRNDRRFALYERMTKVTNMSHFAGQAQRPVLVGNAELARSRSIMDGIYQRAYGNIPGGPLGVRRNRHIQMMHCYDAAPFWRFAASPSADYVGYGVTTIPEHETICLYPGSDNWVTHAPQLVNILA